MKKNNPLKKIFEKAGKIDSRIVLPELNDDRVGEASEKLQALGFTIVTVQDADQLKSGYAEQLKRRSFSRNWPDEMLHSYLDDPVHCAAAMLAFGEADGMVCGATKHHEEVVRTAIRIIGIQKKARFVFSSTMLVPPDDRRILTYADCNIVPEPKPLELAEIAGQAALFHRFVNDEEPLVAFLSFSTRGDVHHYRVNKVLEGMQKFSKKYKELKFDGELQADAALDPEAAERKIGSSDLGGQANVLIFPNMDAGNIACKITERLAGYAVMGPRLFGLNKPVSLVSRACSVQDIVNTTVLTVLGKAYDAHV